jgi:DedD protein
VERRAKERLVGAIVLMAAAIILIPEMLSGPREQTPPKSAAPDGPLKTYTIDLSRPPGTASPTQPAAQEVKPPPPEAVATPTTPMVATQVNPEVAVGTTPSPPVQRDAAEAPANPTREPRMAASAPPAAPRSVEPLASAANAPTSRGWAVQLGSFSKESTAQKMATDLKAGGHDAFVMPVKSGAGTLYRVRVGPMADRAAAEASLRKLKTLAPGATIVSHPLNSQN